MKEKGLVMEINGQNVILLTNDGQFISRRISGLCPQIGDEINIEEEKQKKVWFSVRVLVAAAVLIVTIFAGKLWSEFQVPLLANGVESYVTVDINPSVEMGLDQKKTVVTVLPLNQDGRLLLEGLFLKGLTTEEAVEAFINAAAREGYLAPEKENQVIISVSEKVPDKSQDEQIIQVLSEKAEQTLAEQKLQVKIDVISTDFDLREKAKYMGISSGKYAILVEAKEAGLNIDVKSIKKSGVTKAIKDAGGDLEEIIKSAQEETDFSGKIKKWQQQLNYDTKLIKEEEKNNRNVLKEIKKNWREEEKREKNKEKPNKINEKESSPKKQEKDRKEFLREIISDYEKFNKDSIIKKIDKDKVKEINKDNKKEDNNKEDSRQNNKKDNKDKDKDTKKDNDKDNNRNYLPKKVL